MSKQSLASKQVVESNPGAGDFMPGAFGGGGTQAAPSPAQRTPYVQFVSTKSVALVAKIQQQIRDFTDGEPILIQGGMYVRLNPFRFYLVSSFKHWSKVNNSGELIETTLDKETADEHNKTAAREDKYQSHVETCLIVPHNGELTPVTCTFKTLKTNAVEEAIKAAALSQDLAAWSKLGPAYKASATIPIPHFRFHTLVSLRRKTFKGSGSAGVIADGTVIPTSSMEEIDAQNAFMKDVGKKKLCEAVWGRFQDRVEDIKAGV